MKAKIGAGAAGILVLLFLPALLLAGIRRLEWRGEGEQMLSYMREKYREDFMQVEVCKGQFGKDYAMIRVRSESRPEESALVRSLPGEKRIFQDNYIAFLLRNEIEQRVRSLAEPVFGECKVFYRIPDMVFPAEFPADMRAEDFLRNPLSMVRVYIYVKGDPREAEKLFGEYCRAVREAGYILGGVVSWAKDPKMYELVNGDNFRGDFYQGYEYLLEAIFSMDAEGELIYLRWKEEMQNQ